MFVSNLYQFEPNILTLIKPKSEDVAKECQHFETCNLDIWYFKNTNENIWTLSRTFKSSRFYDGFDLFTPMCIEIVWLQSINKLRHGLATSDFLWTYHRMLKSKIFMAMTSGHRVHWNTCWKMNAYIPSSIKQCIPVTASDVVLRGCAPTKAPLLLLSLIGSSRVNIDHSGFWYGTIKYTHWFLGTWYILYLN